MGIKKDFFRNGHVMIATKVGPVRDLAAGAGAKLTWDFSQSREPVRSWITSDTKTAPGICEMVSAKWLELHMWGDQHISAWLGSGSQINLARIHELMILVKKGLAAPNQTEVTRAWLEDHGVRRFQQSHDVRGSRKRRVLAARIADELVNADNAFRTHKLLGIFGIFAHSCACWSHDDVVVYMDPNFGEFTFNDKASFIHWFPLYWHAAGYGTPGIGMSESYEVDYFIPGRIAERK